MITLSRICEKTALLTWKVQVEILAIFELIATKIHRFECELMLAMRKKESEKMCHHGRNVDVFDEVNF